MNVNSILSDIKSRRFKPAYLLHGEEAYYIDLISDALERNVLTEAQKGFDQTVLYGKDTDFSTIVNVCKRYPMMSDHQLVIVKEAQDLKWKADDEMLINYMKQPTPTTVLVLDYKYSKFDKRKKIYKAIEAGGVVLESNKLYDDKIGGWISAYVEDRRSKIHPHAAALMAEYLGTNLSKVANELDKLMLNVAKDQEIGLLDIEKNIGISKDYNVFELNSAISKRDLTKVIRIVDYFAANPKNHPTPMVIGMLSTHFTKVLKYHYLSNKAPQAVAKELGVHPFFTKEYELAARNYNKIQIFRAVHHLKNFDMKSKGVDIGPFTSNHELLREMVIQILS